MEGERRDEYNGRKETGEGRKKRGGWRKGGGMEGKVEKVNKTVSFIIYTCTCIYVHVHVEKVV